MGRKLTASEETQLLTDTIRAGHELLRDLRVAIKEAQSLAPQLVTRFEQVADDEIKDLCNQLHQQSMRLNAQLNADTIAARDYITAHLFASPVTIDVIDGTPHLVLPGIQFHTDAPPPFPERINQGEHQ